ncbi:MAG TPA: SDR family NAD(P)-dependent oxidoreductase [Polyangiaceae bacterium LLY-WYZ-15_(1-7)]|nr:SDR family NAD(P)-dependent oxidoreductase [Polyangiaceae bacterium LLY-WYZ-15_(1-7)]
MSLYAMIRGRRGDNGFGYASTAEEVTAGVDLGGKTILITGVSSGLGQESARVLAARGATILGAARTREKAEAACREIGGAVPLACELADPASVRACVAEAKGHGPLDVILCNAGIMALPERELVHGQEKQLFVNHVGHFLLVKGLLDAPADDGRVVMLSSAAHGWAPPAGIQLEDLSFERGYKPAVAYGQSKLANLLFARELAQRFEGTARTANAVHPGVIATNLGRHMPLVARALMPVASAVAMKSIPQGAATQCYVAAHPDAGRVSGEYWADCNVTKSSRHGRDLALAKRLWERTEEIVAAL